MTKQEQFLWVVQTVILANVGNVGSQPEHAAKYRHVISASGVVFTASEAIWASERIPGGMSAQEAAGQFTFWMLENLRGSGDTVPGWFARS